MTNNLDLDAHITLAEAGAMIGVSAERVRKLINAGFIEKAARGRVTLASAARGYAKYWQAKAAQQAATPASRVSEARAVEIEMRVADMQLRLIPIEDAVAEQNILVSTVFEEMDDFPTRVAEDDALRDKIRAEIDGSKKRISAAHRIAVKCLRTGDALPFDKDRDA